MEAIPIVTAATAVVSLALLSWMALRKPPAVDVAPFRQEVASIVGMLGSTLAGAYESAAQMQRERFDHFASDMRRLVAEEQQRFDAMKQTVDDRLKEIHVIVDEKLQSTLTQRLGESFARVTERLEQVHKGLGEMQTLANGVGDLKKVLSNVKSRGGWGEVQLEALLEQMLSPEQYERNAVTKEASREAVEFAVKFPGKGETPLLLPLDAKFPVEDYQQLVEAHECGDAEAVEAAGRRLDASVRNSAKTIRQKYVNPPVTTDFAILFLPTEGLYAEVLRRPGLAEQIQRDFGVLIAGPTTLTAILSSLQMGFRTLAIEKRSSEVWRLLEAVKTEFLRFGGVIEKVNRNLETARNQMDALATRTRVVSRKLHDVQELPEPDAKLLLTLSPPTAEVDDEEEAIVR